jgi:hypothetical protein
LTFLIFFPPHSTSRKGADGLSQNLSPVPQKRSPISLFYLAGSIIGWYCYRTAFSVARLTEKDEKSSIIHTGALAAVEAWRIECI